MPSAWRVHVIGQRLIAEGLQAIVTERDLYSLDGAERHAVLDVLSGGDADLPMVVVAGRVACAGELDMAAIVRSAREVTAGD